MTATAKKIAAGAEEDPLNYGGELNLVDAPEELVKEVKTGYTFEPVVIDAIREVCKFRRGTQKMEQRISRGCDALMVRAMGLPMETKADRAKAFKVAQGIFNVVKKAMKELGAYKQTVPYDKIVKVVVAKVPAKRKEVTEEFLPMMVSAAMALIPVGKKLKEYDKILEKQVEALTIWPAVDRIRGIGAVSFGMLIGEIGDFNKYANPAKVWKRMGVAVHNGVRQKLRRGEAGITEGYNPPRRAVLWIVTASLLKNNQDRYQGIQKARYTFELAKDDRMKKDAKPARELTDNEKHGRAMARSYRYASKALLKDIWRLWTGEIDSINLASNATT